MAIPVSHWPSSKSAIARLQELTSGLPVIQEPFAVQCFDHRPLPSDAAAGLQIRPFT